MTLFDNSLSLHQKTEQVKYVLIFLDVDISIFTIKLIFIGMYEIFKSMNLWKI